MDSPSRVISVALKEVGYLEKKSPDKLDDPKVNAGTMNYTKYARDLDMVGYYNISINGYAWCKVFFDWCMYKAFGKNTSLKMTYRRGRYGTAGCSDSRRDYMEANAYIRNTIGYVMVSPQKGDEIFFTSDNGKTCCHTGLVIEVDDRNQVVYTVEGNTSSANEVVPNGGSVCLKSYNYSTNSKIDGYGRPKWDLYVSPDDKESEDDYMKYYEHLPDVPSSYKPSIRKLMEKKALVGSSNPDKNSLDDNVINVSEDFCRIVTVLNRLGLFDK